MATVTGGVSVGVSGGGVFPHPVTAVGGMGGKSGRGGRVTGFLRMGERSRREEGLSMESPEGESPEGVLSSSPDDRVGDGVGSVGASVPGFPFPIG